MRYYLTPGSVIEYVGNGQVMVIDTLTIMDEEDFVFISGSRTAESSMRLPIGAANAITNRDYDSDDDYFIDTSRPGGIIIDNTRRPGGAPPSNPDPLIPGSVTGPVGEVVRRLQARWRKDPKGTMRDAFMTGTKPGVAGFEGEDNPFFNSRRRR